jgi:hypothetical protein
MQCLQQQEVQAGTNANERQRPNTAGNVRRTIAYPTENRQPNIQQYPAEPHI